MLDVFGTPLATPVHTFGLRNALDLKLVQLELGFPYYRLPLTAIASSMSPTPGQIRLNWRRSRRLLDGIEADMLALTGDVQGTHSAPISLSTRLLEEALEGVRVAGPRLAVLGTTTRSRWPRSCSGWGSTRCLNRSIALQVRVFT